MTLKVSRGHGCKAHSRTFGADHCSCWTCLPVISSTPMCSCVPAFSVCSATTDTVSTSAIRRAYHNSSRRPRSAHPSARRSHCIYTPLSNLSRLQEIYYACVPDSAFIPRFKFYEAATKGAWPGSCTGTVSNPTVARTEKRSPSICIPSSVEPSVVRVKKN